MICGKKHPRNIMKHLRTAFAFGICVFLFLKKKKDFLLKIWSFLQKNKWYWQKTPHFWQKLHIFYKTTDIYDRKPIFLTGNPNFNCQKMIQMSPVNCQKSITSFTVWQYRPLPTSIIIHPKCYIMYSRVLNNSTIQLFSNKNFSSIC